MGPSTAVLLHNLGVREKQEDVIEAIERLNPYPIKRIGFWELSKPNFEIR